MFTYFKERWEQRIPIKFYPTLMWHLLHIAVACAVVLLLQSLGVERLLSHSMAAVLFLVVELSTMIIKKNYKDSIFDYEQYSFHWVLYVFAISETWIPGAFALVIFILLYFMLLKKGW